ncbi:MAG: hypothetical protein U1E49_05260 [Hyphomicrobiaceae bacterium]
MSARNKLYAYIEQCADLLAQELDDDVVAQSLVENGCDPELADRIIAHLPSAYARRVLDELGVRENDSYSQPLTNGKWIAVPYARDPVWRAALAFAKADFQRGNQRDAQGRIAQRSAEIDSLNAALEAGSDPKEAVSATAFTGEISASSPVLTEYRRARFLALLIMLASIAGLFATGWGFGLFGKPIDLVARPLETLLFFACPAVGAFGFGYGHSIGRGMRLATALLLGYATLGLLGYLSRHL